MILRKHKRSWLGGENSERSTFTGCLWDRHVTILASPGIHRKHSRRKRGLDIWIWKWSECKLKYMNLERECIQERTVRALLWAPTFEASTRSEEHWISFEKRQRRVRIPPQSAQQRPRKIGLECGSWNSSKKAAFHGVMGFNLPSLSFSVFFQFLKPRSDQLLPLSPLLLTLHLPVHQLAMRAQPHHHCWRYSVNFSGRLGRWFC